MPSRQQANQEGAEWASFLGSLEQNLDYLTDETPHGTPLNVTGLQLLAAVRTAMKDWRVGDTEFRDKDRVIVISVDLDALTGREKHPHANHEGMHGTVCRVMCKDVFGWCLTNEPVASYLVELDDGAGYFEFVDYELEREPLYLLHSYAGVAIADTTESKTATLRRSSKAQTEPTGDKRMTPQTKSIQALIELGWSLRKFHSDGIADMTKTYEGRDTVMMFVHTDGCIRPPRTSGTMIAEAELHDAQLGTRTGRGIEPEWIDKYEDQDDPLSDHEHCKEAGKCWQGNYPCPALSKAAGD